MSENPQKMAKEEEAKSDRMSQLPDAILQHILSFMDTNHAVQTTILSRRWQNLWRSIPDLNFTLTRLAADRHVSLKNRQSLQTFSHRFTNFVSHFLSLRDRSSAICHFRLSFDSRLVHVDAKFVEKCVDYAIGNGVVSLRLHALCRPAMRFSDGFSGCKTLRELELKQFGYGVCLPEQFSLPNLEILCLENSNFIEDGDLFAFSKEPFSRFPALEKLTLRRCTVYGLVILAPKLRVLEIVMDKLFCEPMKEISCSILTLLKYEGYFPLECSTVNTPSLEEVYFNIYKKMGEKNKRMPLRCVNMMHKFGNAKFVTLSLDTIKVIELDPCVTELSPSPFPHIKRLKLTKGRREIPIVLERVVNFLSYGGLCGVEIPEGVSVVEKNWDEESSELQLQQLFGIQDEIGFQVGNFGAFQELLTPKFRQDGTFML